MALVGRSLVKGLPRVTISNNCVRFDGEEVLWPIDAGGILVRPGGRDEYNTVQITFLAEDIEVFEEFPVDPTIGNPIWDELVGAYGY